MICAGCNREIKDGQHALRVSVELFTPMPEEWQPTGANDQEPWKAEIVLDTAGCFLSWAALQPAVKEALAP